MPKNEGGLALCDLETKDKALKISWIKILQGEPKLSELVYANHFPVLKEYFWECSLASKHVVLFVQDSFWKAVAQAWCELKEKECAINIHKEIIWLNSKILVNKKPILWKKAFEAKLIYVSQLFEDGVVIGIDKAKQFSLNTLQLNTLIVSIPKEWKKSLMSSQQKPNVTQSFSDIMKSKKDLVRYAYACLLPISSLKEKVNKWQESLGCEIPYDSFMSCFKRIYTVTNVAKYRSFQFRLLHRAIITNIHLYKWKKRDNDLCTFCNKHRETYLHLFIYCPFVRDTWIQLEQFMEVFSEEPINFGLDTVICDQIVSGRNIKNFLCLMFKQYIYKQHCLNQPISLEQFISLVWKTKGIEKFIAIKNGKLKYFYKKWESYSKEAAELRNNLNEYILE